MAALPPVDSYTMGNIITLLTDKALPETQKWTLRKARGLETSDRLLKPTWAKRWREARDGVESFLTYKDGKPSQQFVEYLVMQGILSRNQIWPPSDSESEPSEEATEATPKSTTELKATPKLKSTEQVEAATNKKTAPPALSQKRGRSKEKKPKPVQKKSPTAKRQKSSPRAASVSSQRSQSSTRKSVVDGQESNVGSVTDDTYLHALQPVEVYMLEFVVVARRRCKELSNEEIQTTQQTAELLGDILASQKGIITEVKELAASAQNANDSDDPTGDWKLQIERSQFIHGGVVEFLTSVKTHLLRLEDYLYRRLGALREGSPSSPSATGSTIGPRLELLVDGIAKHLENLREEINQVASQNEAAASGELVSSEGSEDGQYFGVASRSSGTQLTHVDWQFIAEICRLGERVSLDAAITWEGDFIGWDRSN